MISEAEAQYTMTETSNSSADKNTQEAREEGQFHSYQTHHIPWYVRVMWIAFWVGAVWYTIKYAIPMAKNYF